MFRKPCIFLTVMFFALAFLSLIHAEPEIKLTANIDKKKIAVGERVILTAELEWEETGNEEIRIAEISPPQCPLLELLNSSQVSKSELRAGKVISKQILKYVFKAKEEGIDKITALTAGYAAGQDGEELIISSEPIEIKVISLKEKLISSFGLMVAVVAGIFATILSAFLLLKRRRKRQNCTGLGEPANARWEREAADRLKEITKYRLAGDFKRYYSSLHNTLADYAKAKYHIEVENKDEDEIKKLSSVVDLPVELSRLLIETAQLSERVKFAGYEVNPNEEKRIFDNIQKYLRALISKEKEEKIELAEENKNKEA